MQVVIICQIWLIKKKSIHTSVYYFGNIYSLLMVNSIFFLNNS